MARQNDDHSALIYMLAGVGLGAIIGAAAGLLFAPKAGTELREDIGDRVKGLKDKAESWVSEQKDRAIHKAEDAVDELGA